MTREVLISAGIDCPMVYGDPAMILPLLYTPKNSKTNRTIYIPHHSIYTFSKSLFKDQTLFKIINPKNRKSLKIVDEIFNANVVLSSSLHGLIIADAYGIPNIWVKLDDKVLTGQNFKYYDYFSSVGRNPNLFLNFEELTHIDDINLLPKLSDAIITNEMIINLAEKIKEGLSFYERTFYK
jgi:pyruvyltransferase